MLSTGADAAVGSVKRRCSRSQPTVARTLITSNALRKREHIQHASLGCVLRQVSHGLNETQARCCVTRIVPTGDNRPRPASNSGEYRHVLLPVGSFISNWLT